MKIFSAKIDEGLDVYLRVCVWDDREEYDKSKRRAGSGAFYQQPEIRVIVEDDGFLRIPQKTIGIIHLCEGEFGTGEFAHELTHFMVTWMEFVRAAEPPGGMSEYMAGMVGDITNRFWYWHFMEVRDGKR